MQTRGRFHANGRNVETRCVVGSSVCLEDIRVGLQGLRWYESVTARGHQRNAREKHTLRLGALFGEAITEDIAEALSSVIELNVLWSRPEAGGPRISICDIVVDACESEDLLLR